MHLHRFGSAVLAVACAATLAACGADTSTAPATMTKQSFAAHVAAATAHTTSVHVTATVSARGMAFHVKGDLAVNGKTVKDLVARFDVSSMLPRGRATLLISNGAAYLKTVGFPMPTHSAKPWLEADLTDPSNQVASLYHKVMAQLDPASMAKVFKATTQLRRVGAATVGGVATTHYVVTVDTAKVLRLLGLRGMAGSESPEAQKYLPKTFDYDVWLDRSQRPVRIKGAYAGFAVDMTFGSWGEAVSVSVPPASRVSKISL